MIASRHWVFLPTVGAAALLLLLVASTLARAEDQQPQPQQPQTCTLQAGPTRSVVRVIDAETVLLDDDEEVRLIGALAPRSPDLKPDADAWPPEQDAVAALRDLVVGRSVELATSGRAKDRYGHLLAHLFVDENGERVWVQGRLLSTGHARAYGLPESFACARELLAHERVAREALAGLWANAAYATRAAGDGKKLLRYRNSYQIVEGSVVRVKVAKSRTYLDFGPDWRTDFSAGIDAKVVHAHPEWAKTLAGLQGRRVEVRGWIEYRSGPYIAIEDPSQLAIIDEGAQPSPPSPAPGGPVLSSERPNGEGSGEARKRKRPAQKLPGVDL
jgi:micrococcal nuclease